MGPDDLPNNLIPPNNPAGKKGGLQLSKEEMFFLEFLIAYANRFEKKKRLAMLQVLLSMWNKGYFCWGCGSDKFSLHHVIPKYVSKTARFNIKVPLCKNCHGLIHDGEAGKRYAMHDTLNRGENKGVKPKPKKYKDRVVAGQEIEFATHKTII